VVFHGEKDNGIGVAKVYKDGRVEARTPRDPDKVLSINAPENAQSTNDNNQATDNNSNAQAQNNEQSQSQATDNAKVENNTQSQNQSQALPE
ncbi:LPXTG cell wall anchor domain-containing protein, partial [Staphylococcus epidermidis]